MPPVSFVFIQALSQFSSNKRKMDFLRTLTAGQGPAKEAETARELLPVLKDAINDPDRSVMREGYSALETLAAMYPSLAKEAFHIVNAHMAGPLSLYDAPDKNRIYEAEGRIGRFAQMYPAGVTEILARGLTRRSLCEGGRTHYARNGLEGILAARPEFAPACADEASDEHFGDTGPSPSSLIVRSLAVLAPYCNKQSGLTEMTDTIYSIATQVYSSKAETKTVRNRAQSLLGTLCGVCSEYSKGVFEQVEREIQAKETHAITDESLRTLSIITVRAEPILAQKAWTYVDKVLSEPKPYAVSNEGYCSSFSKILWGQKALLKPRHIHTIEPVLYSNETAGHMSALDVVSDALLLAPELVAKRLIDAVVLGPLKSKDGVAAHAALSILDRVIEKHPDKLSNKAVACLEQMGVDLKKDAHRALNGLGQKRANNAPKQGA